jgi:hypothetical protein
MKKLAVYDQAKQQEIFIITLIYNTTDQAVSSALAELRELAEGHNIDGWVNEYDLTWSKTEYVNKHSLDY